MSIRPTGLNLDEIFFFEFFAIMKEVNTRDPLNAIYVDLFKRHEGSPHLLAKFLFHHHKSSSQQFFWNVTTLIQTLKLIV